MKLRLGSGLLGVVACVLCVSAAEADGPGRGPGDVIVMPIRPNAQRTLGPRVRHGKRFQRLDDNVRRASWNHVIKNLPKAPNAPPNTSPNGTGTLIASATVTTAQSTGGMRVGMQNGAWAVVAGTPDSEPAFAFYRTPAVDDAHAPVAYVMVPTTALKPATNYWLDCTVGAYDDAPGAQVTIDIGFSAADATATSPMPANGHLVVGFKSVDAFAAGSTTQTITLSGVYGTAGAQLWQFDGCELYQL